MISGGHYIDDDSWDSQGEERDKLMMQQSRQEVVTAAQARQQDYGWKELVRFLGIPEVCMKHMKKRVETDAEWSLIPSSFKRSGMRERVVTDAEKKKKKETKNRRI